MSNILLSEAENELVAIYSEKLSEEYAKGHLKSANEYADKILRYLPDDLFAGFVKGAVVGRGSTAGNLHIVEAFDLWKPLMTQADEEDRAALQNAVRDAFAIMTNTPLELGIRRWSAYLDAASIESLADTLEAYLQLPKILIEQSEQDGWIANLIAENRFRWTSRVIEVNTQIPTGDCVEVIDGFYRFAYTAYEHAKRIPFPLSKEAAIIRGRSLAVLERFERINGDSGHPERSEYLAREQKAFAVLAD